MPEQDRACFKAKLPSHALPNCFKKCLYFWASNRKYLVNKGRVSNMKYFFQLMFIKVLSVMKTATDGISKKYE